MVQQKKRVLTGSRPSGTPHLGNYFGAYKPLIDLQGSFDFFFFLADFHALNGADSAVEIRQNSFIMMATMIACGLDPTQGLIYAQSAVPEVCELAWMIGCQAPYGMLTRAHSFKDAVAKGVEVNMGVFSYPILMAADILIFDAVALVPGTDGEKMSKSKNNTVSIFASDKEWHKQVMAIVTGSAQLAEPKDPETCTVFALFKLLASAEEIEEMAIRYKSGGYGYGHAKLALIEKLKAVFGPMRDRYFELINRPDDLRELLLTGSGKARLIAREKLDRIQQVMGLIGRPF